MIGAGPVGAGPVGSGPVGSGPVGSGPVGWVCGEPVPASALEDYLAALAGSAAGARLGIGDLFGAGAGSGLPATCAHGAGSHRAGAEHGASEGTTSEQLGERFTKGHSLRAWALKSLLADRLLSVEAERLGVRDLGSAEEWLRALEAAGELAEAGAGGAPSEAETLACYQASQYRYTTREARRVRHLLVADKALAEELAREASGDARSGGPGDVAEVGDRDGQVARFARLAQEWSLDGGTRASGGDLGWVERGQLAGPVEDAIFSSSPGDIHGPVESSFGWHVVVVEAVRPASARPFPECRQEILEELAADRRRAALREWWARRLAEAVVVPAGAEHPRDPGLPGSVHRH